MDDLISRQAAIDEITEYGSGDTIYMSVAELKRRIEHLPPAQPEHNKGLWHWADGMYSCDQCGETLDEKSPFCPMCGADMRGKKDEPEG